MKQPEQSIEPIDDNDEDDGTYYEDTFVLPDEDIKLYNLTEEDADNII